MLSQECFRRNPKQFIYDKSLPKGNKSERLVSLFLEHSCNPKGKLAYKLFSTMQEEKKVKASIIWLEEENPQSVLNTLEYLFHNWLSSDNANSKIDRKDVSYHFQLIRNRLYQDIKERKEVCNG